MLTWKVWADQDLLCEGDEDKARQYLLDHPDDLDLALESPDGDTYRYEGGTWVFHGVPHFWEPDDAYGN